MTAKKTDTITEITSDGQQTITEGSEPLKKDPKKKRTFTKSLRDRWDLIKASMQTAFAPLDNSIAIPHADDILGIHDEEQQGAGHEIPQQGQEDDTPPQGDEQPQEQSQEQEDPNAIYEAMKEHGYSDDEINYIMSGHGPAIEDPKVKRDDREHELALQHKQQAHEAKLKGDEQKHGHTEKLHEEKLKAEAQRRALEMAQIEAKEMRADELHESDKKHHEHELEHKKRLAEHEISLKEKQAQHEMDMAMQEKELELAHKKRMLDLEYKNAQEEAKLDLEMARHKMKFDMQQAALDAESKREIKEHQYTVKLKQAKEDAKNPDKKENK